jgi:predicted nucleic acid-binding protein
MGLVLLDTSIWIELFGKSPKVEIKKDDLLSLAICPPVIQEILQGVRDDLTHKKLARSILALPCLEPLVGVAVYQEASDIYRSGRRRGFTLRSSVDCLIAAIAIKNQVPIWHKDRDYDVIARFTNLKIQNKI